MCRSPKQASISVAFVSFKKRVLQGAFCASEIFPNLCLMHLFVETAIV